MFSKEVFDRYYNTINGQIELEEDKKYSWGFYFSHDEKGILEEAKSIFIDKKFDSVEICSDCDIFYLNLEKIEANTPQSLYEKCLELEKIKNNLNINEFIGFDVEEI